MLAKVLDLAAHRLTREMRARGYDGQPVALSGGRTNRVWRFGTHVAKLYVPRDNNPLFPNLPFAEWTCLRELAPLGLAPEPVEHFETELGEVIVYRHVAGTRWKGGPQQVAQMLDRLHGADLSGLGFRNLPNGGPAVLAHGARILQACRDQGLLEQARPEVPDVGPVAPVLVHTDVTPANIVAAFTGPMLIDWQCPGYGDPVEDIAVFLSPAMNLIYGSGAVDPASEAAFLDEFTNSELRERFRRMAPAYHWRMAAYCQWRMESGVSEYAPARDAELAALRTYR